MWISRKKWMVMEKKISDLELALQGQICMTNLNHEFCKSVANKNKMSFSFYQQLYSPSSDSDEKVRMLFDKIRELG